MHIVFETERVVCVASFIQYIYVIRIILHDQKKGFRTPSNSNEIYTYTVKKTDFCNSTDRETDKLLCIPRPDHPFFHLTVT
jgi:hypothetical protein